MKINVLKKEIDFGLLFIILLSIFGLPPEVFFVISFVYYIFLLLKNHGKTYIPIIPGIRIYVCIILIAIVIGMMVHPIRNVLRDAYYVLPTMLWVFIGYHLKKREKNNRYNIFKTLYIYGGCVSLVCMARFLFDFTLDFSEIKTIFTTNVYEIGFILPIFIMEVLLTKRVVFSKLIDCFLIIVMTIQIILSLGRIAILQPIIALLVFSFILARYNSEQRKVFRKLMVLLLMFVVIFTFIFSILPSDITDIFADKLSYTLDEVDSTKNINSVSEAMSNWRGYEIQLAWEQWKESNIWKQIFGAGMGKSFYIEYVPTTWQSFVINNEIPLLHNGFFTLLPKIGFLGMSVFVYIFLGCIYKGWKYIRDPFVNKDGSCTFLVGIMIASIATTYVACGPVRQGTFLAWGLLLGYLNENINANLRTKGEYAFGNVKGSTTMNVTHNMEEK